MPSAYPRRNDLFLRVRIDGAVRQADRAASTFRQDFRVHSFGKLNKRPPAAAVINSTAVSNYGNASRRTRAAKVSVATVSKALSADAENYRISKECRDRVADVCRELGYQPNFLGRSLRARASRRPSEA